MADDPPPETLVEKREELMVSPLGGQSTLRTAHFLKPSSSAAIEDIPPFSLSPNPIFSSIKKTQLAVKFRGRRRPQKDWETWVNHLQPTHHQTWEKAGIFEAIMASKYQTMRQNDLVIALAERWNPETNTFIFPWGESTVTLEDMMVLGGFSVLGSSVFTTLETKDSIMAEESLWKTLKDISRSRKSGFPSHNDWVKHFMDTGNKLEHEAFLALWLSRYVLPTTYDTLSRIVFPVAVLLSRGTPIALAPVVLANIYRDLSLLKKSITSCKNIGGCGSRNSTLELWAPFQLVQVWAWERFPTLRPNPNLIISGEPRIARWHRLRYLKVENERIELNSAEDCFQWRPYTVVVNNWSFSKFYRENEEWAVVEPGVEIELVALALCIRPSELGGLACIEQYLPHRVSMQFGIDQDLPGHVPRFNKNTEAAWKNYMRPITGTKLYIPARLFESDVTAQYLSWRTMPCKLSSRKRKRLPLVDIANEDANTTELNRPFQKTNEDGEAKGSGLDGDDGPFRTSSSSTSKYLQKGDDKITCARSLSSSKDSQEGDIGRVIDLSETDESNLSLEDCPLEKMMENGEEESITTATSEIRRVRLDLEARVNKLEILVDQIEAGKLGCAHSENAVN